MIVYFVCFGVMVMTYFFFPNVKQVLITSISLTLNYWRDGVKPSFSPNRAMAELDPVAPATALKMGPSSASPTITPAAESGPKPNPSLSAIISKLYNWNPTSFPDPQVLTELTKSLNHQLTGDDYWQLFQVFLTMEEKLLQVLLAREKQQQGLIKAQRKPRLDRDQCAFCKKRGHWVKDCPNKNDSR